MENPIKMADLGVPLFLETSIYNIYDLKICFMKFHGFKNQLRTYVGRCAAVPFLGAPWV